ncbi:MAG: hypothetical protein WCJ87_14150, partial [Burkholderiales bacterium]
LASLAISTRLTPLAQSNAAWNTAREAILIFGWVALWHPLEALLFGWRAMAERLRLLERIASAEYRFAFDAHTHRPEGGDALPSSG